MILSFRATLCAQSPGDIDHLAFRLIEQRNNEGLAVLVSEGFPINTKSKDGTTLLMYAALHGDADGVRLLLEAGADPLASNDHGATALIWGASDVHKVRLLVEKGAKVNAVTKSGMTPLASAAAHAGGAKSVAYLLEKGANHHAKAQGFLGLTSLGIACFNGNLESVKALLKHGRSEGQTPVPLTHPLRAAVMRGNREIAEFLLAWKGPHEFDRKQLETPLSEALGHADMALARLLIAHGARATEVHSVAYSDIELDAILPELLEHKPDLTAEAWRDLTALDLARDRGHHKLEQLLKQAGASAGATPKKKEIPRRGIRLTEANQSEVIKKSVGKGMSLLMRSSDAFLRSRQSCNSCHHQDLPAMAASISLSRGIDVNQDSLAKILRRQKERWNPDQLNLAYDAAHVGGGATDAFNHLLWGWSARGVAPNAISKTAVWFLASRQLPEGSWPAIGVGRMPLSDGQHQPTALGIRAFTMYPLEGREKEFEERIHRARQWLEENPGRLHTHRAFRLLGLAWADADASILKQGMEELRRGQRKDGGWSQLVNLESDAWATGLALVALEAAGLDPSHPDYRRGMEFLVNTQFKDGSWFVKSRSEPVIFPHFDSHFPHGKDQWISAAGTALACASLALALEPVKSDIVIDDLSTDHRLTESEGTIISPPVPKEPFKFEGVRTVDFKKDIRPLLEDSCLDCHGSEKTKGEFKVVNRAALLKGGSSLVPAIVPGKADESQLIRHVTDQAHCAK